MASFATSMQRGRWNAFSVTDPRRAKCVCRGAVDVAQLKGLRRDLGDYIVSKSCNPIVVRLAWHDSGTYDKNESGWPQAGGANASIRFPPEVGHLANTGLRIAMELLEPFKVKYPAVSYADIYQMASATAVEVAGGPIIPMQYGRADAVGGEDCAKEGNLPAAAAPFNHLGKDAASHLRIIFYRMGFNDQEIVVLSGGHTLGRARADRGYPDAKKETKYTKSGPGTPGGQSWTADWLTFNNSYFVEVKAKRDAELLVMPTDAVIFEDAAFRPYAEQYAADQELFFKDYAVAHAKLSELGVKWEEGGPVTL